jgi:acyl-CoA synthetase (AMP-forming)/AMP-acid ligase II
MLASSRLLEGTPPCRSISHILRARATLTPDELAYCFLRNGETEDGQFSYFELHRQAARLAMALMEGGFKAGDRALLLLPQSLDYVVALYACFYAGIVAVPAYPPVRPNHVMRLQSVAQASDSKLILTIRETLNVFGPAFTASPVLSLLGSFAVDEIRATPGAGYGPVDVDPHSAALLQYTSGSTGSPKGAVVTHANILVNQEIIRIAYGSRPLGVVVSWLPLFHDMGLIFGLMHPLFLGTPGYLMTPLSFLQKPLRWLVALSRYRAQMSAAPNFAYDLCVSATSEAERAQLDLSHWQVAFNGAEQVRADTLERFAETFAICGFDAKAAHPCYGMAESTLMASGGHDDGLPRIATVDGEVLDATGMAVPVAATDRRARRIVSCGRPRGEARLVIVDPETHAPCETGRVGEMWLAGPHIVDGYWNHEATVPTFQARTTTGEGPYLRTGDMGFVDGDGEVFMTSRLKDLVVIRGRNYAPNDIEQAVERAHPAIRENGVAAFTVPGPQGDVLTVAAEIHKEATAQFDAAAVLRRVRAAISSEFDLRLETLVFIRRGKLPRTTSGKIQRSACRRDFLDNALALFEPPSPMSRPVSETQPA